MKGLDKKDARNILILLLTYAVIIIAITRFTNIYGSKLDWQEQHWAIPEYFRMLFYDTGDLFPGFAFNLGAGQNIYYFSYYGLFSPIILFSYLLPFVSMVDYLIAASIIAVAASDVMIYLRLRRDYSARISFISSFLFLCSGSLIFHSHRHIMFVIYMPFLLLALNGVDRLLERRGCALLTLGTFLVIMSSYFFSVGSIFVMALYAVYRYLSRAEKFSVRELLGHLLRFCGSILTAVAMSAVLLLPTAYTLLCGRDPANVTIHSSDLLIPSVNLDFFLYSPYSLGVSAVFLLTLFTLVIDRKKHNVFLSICFFFINIVPGIIYLFNGTLYTDAKVLIPFLPLTVILISEFMVRLQKNGFSRRIFIPVAIFGAAGALAYRGAHKLVLLLFLAELAVYAAELCMMNRERGRRLFVVSLLLFSFTAALVTNLNDDLVTRGAFRERFGGSREALVEKAVKSEDDIFRISDQRRTMDDINRVCGVRHYTSTLYSSISNRRYNKFFHRIICNENPYRNSAIISQSRSVIFDILMGAKYLISDGKAPAGYKPVTAKRGLSLYRTENAFPVAFSSGRTLSYDKFRALSYPETAEALLKYTVTENGGDVFESELERADFELTEIIPAVPMITHGNDSLTVKSGADFELTAKLPEEADNKILFISFDVDNTAFGEDMDTYICINDVQNKLTCKSWKYYNGNTRFCYTISSEDCLGELKFLFSKGRYRISDASVKMLDYEDVVGLADMLCPMDFDMDATHGDVIAGDIDCRGDGWFELTVPYDRGFEVRVDGKKREYEMVDSVFIGLPIEKGRHRVEITFTPPMLPEGRAVTAAGFAVFVLIAVLDIVKYAKRRGENAVKAESERETI